MKPQLPEDLHMAVITAMNLLQEHDSELFETRANVGTQQERGASERSAAHRLAFYLEAALKVIHFDQEKRTVGCLQEKYAHWNIDCEYNRVMEDQAKFLIRQDLIDARMLVASWVASAREQKETNPEDYFLQFSEYDFKYVEDEIGQATNEHGEQRKKLTSPDITVHERRRNKPEHNWLLIEVKPDWAASKLVLLDLIKLIAFTKKKDTTSPTYQFGLLLHVDEHGKLVNSGKIFSWLLPQHKGTDCQLIAFEM
jgi:hypothetical protein